MCCFSETDCMICTYLAVHTVKSSRNKRCEDVIADSSSTKGAFLTIFQFLR